MIVIFSLVMLAVWTAVVFCAGTDAGRHIERKRMKTRGCDECRNAWWRKHYGKEISSND